MSQAQAQTHGVRVGRLNQVQVAVFVICNKPLQKKKKETKFKNDYYVKYN